MVGIGPDQKAAAPAAASTLEIQRFFCVASRALPKQAMAFKAFVEACPAKKCLPGYSGFQYCPNVCMFSNDLGIVGQ